jgi:hypothetical protein
MASTSASACCESLRLAGELNRKGNAPPVTNQNGWQPLLPAVFQLSNSGRLPASTTMKAAK